MLVVYILLMYQFYKRKKICIVFDSCMYLYGADAVAVLATCSDAASPGFISRTVGFLPRVPRQLALPHLHI